MEKKQIFTILGIVALVVAIYYLFFKDKNNSKESSYQKPKIIYKTQMKKEDCDKMGEGCLFYETTDKVNTGGAISIVVTQSCTCPNKTAAAGNT